MSSLLKPVIWFYHEFGLAAIHKTGRNAYLIILARLCRETEFSRPCFSLKTLADHYTVGLGMLAHGAITLVLGTSNNASLQLTRLQTRGLECSYGPGLDQLSGDQADL